jgi:hypothetical protein
VPFYFDQDEPDQNPQFTRRWSEPPFTLAELALFSQLRGERRPRDEKRASGGPVLPLRPAAQP